MNKMIIINAMNWKMKYELKLNTKKIVCDGLDKHNNKSYLKSLRLKTYNSNKKCLIIFFAKKYNLLIILMLRLLELFILEMI